MRIRRAVQRVKVVVVDQATGWEHGCLGEWRSSSIQIAELGPMIEFVFKRLIEYSYRLSNWRNKGEYHINYDDGDVVDVIELSDRVAGSKETQETNQLVSIDEVERTSYNTNRSRKSNGGHENIGKCDRERLDCDWYGF